MVSMSKVELTRMQRFALRLKGYVYVGHRTRPGWNGSIPFYAFECPVHGIVENYPHGFKSRMECPECGHKVKIKKGGD